MMVIKIFVEQILVIVHLPKHFSFIRAEIGFSVIGGLLFLPNLSVCPRTGWVYYWEFTTMRSTWLQLCQTFSVGHVSLSCSRVSSLVTFKQ